MTEQLTLFDPKPSPLVDWEAECRRLKTENDRWRDCFCEITAKAAPYGFEKDPEHIVNYIIPCGPIHRAAGTMGYQAFGLEQKLAAVLARAKIAEVKLAASEKDAASWKQEWEMYSSAWLRELGGRTIPKAHQIDALVLTTRKMREDLAAAREELRS